ncbi:cupin domain-containing protein [Bradyrhizobium liaoningense]|uniref:cupin domain-containing protein n=1 Tax=Bradyrhizobium liaoningense TaxID=43992 RepID=UPI001BA71243|nr:cupin domain-containing protein [Bradyrhizobium liaoningense]MBR0823761.1 cupin domain-containing protein [Bradyrhizobium liaoningense]
MIRFAGALWAAICQTRRITLPHSLQCLVVGLLASLTSQAYAQQQTEAHHQTDVTIKKLLSTMTTSAGQKIVLPNKGAELIASIFEISPGSQLPEHEHPYPRYGYILSGSLRVTDTDTGQSKTYRPGDFVVESVGRWHTGVSEGQEPTRLLVIDIVQHGHTNTVLRKSRQGRG